MAPIPREIKPKTGIFTGWCSRERRFSCSELADGLAHGSNCCRREARRTRKRYDRKITPLKGVTHEYARQELHLSRR